MSYICATYADNTVLRAHYAFMAHRNGVSIAELKRAAAARGIGAVEIAGDEEEGGGDAKRVCSMYVCMIPLLENIVCKPLLPDYFGLYFVVTG